MREEMPPGCGACCALYTGTVGGVPMFGAFQSALLVISMLALHVKLQLAYYTSYSKQRQSVHRLLATAASDRNKWRSEQRDRQRQQQQDQHGGDGGARRRQLRVTAAHSRRRNQDRRRGATSTTGDGGKEPAAEIMLKPVYYIFVQLASLFFITEAFVTLSLKQSAMTFSGQSGAVEWFGRYFVFALCAFLDNFALLLLWRVGRKLKNVDSGSRVEVLFQSVSVMLTRPWLADALS